MLEKARFNQIIALNIRKLRLEKGISQEDLSADCGFFRTYVGLVENGKKAPSAFSVYRLAKGLGVPVSEIFPSTIQFPDTNALME